MGIFTVPVQSVRNTRIYVSPSDQIPNVQLTLYKNEVNLDLPDGFMILPVPHPQSVRFHHSPVHPVNSSPYLDFLDHVEQAFDGREQLRRRSPIRPSDDPRRLASYEVEVINSINNLRELNEAEMLLHPETLEQLADMYPEPYWGFLLCKLLQGNYIYEPLCYSHRMIGENLFVPSLLFQPRTFRDIHIPEESNRFDDRYFINGTTFPEFPNRNLAEVISSRIHSIPWRVLPNGFQTCMINFLCETRRGLHMNHDLFYPMNPLIVQESYREHRRRSNSIDSVPPPWW